MAQLQTFPFTKLLNPIPIRASTLRAGDSTTDVSGASTDPDSRNLKKTFNVSLLQGPDGGTDNPYYGPDIVVDLPPTSSIALFGQSITLDVEVDGFPLNEFVYTWYRNDEAFVGDEDHIITNNPSGSVLSIPNVSVPDDNDVYYLKINNPRSGINTYSTTSLINVDEELYHPDVIFTIVGAIEPEVGDANPNVE